MNRREHPLMTRRIAMAGAVAATLLATAGTAPAAGLDVAEVNRYVFVPNRASADVAVIDTRTDSVVARVPVGRVPHQVAVSDSAGRMAASNMADDTVSIVDLATLQTLATVALDREPEHMELSPDGLTLAVGNIEAGTVSMVSLADNREIARVDGLHQPHNMTFGPDGSHLFVANLAANFVSVIDVAAARIVQEIPVGDGPALASAVAADGEYQGIINVTRTPDGRLGFAAYGEGDRMAVIDLRTREVRRTLGLGSMPWRAFSTADGRWMIVPNNGDETVSIVSTSTLEEVARLPGAADMTGVNTGWFETVAFVISRGEDKAIVIDLEKMERVGEIDLPSAPETGVTTPDGTRLYVALGGSNRVAVIDTRERRLLHMIDGVGDQPWGAHMVGALNYCH
jgi:YVTN family beta-propeller protein